MLAKHGDNAMRHRFQESGVAPRLCRFRIFLIVNKARTRIKSRDCRRRDNAAGQGYACALGNAWGPITRIAEAR
jgi:hypothetical protein